jgi:outer membrane protein assembly factor BamB
MKISGSFGNMVTMGFLARWDSKVLLKRAGCVGMLVGLLVAMSSAGARADDWPTYRHDIARSGITTERLAPPLSEQWVFKPTHAPEPAWPAPVKEAPRVRFDDAYQVAAVGDAVYFGSSADNKLYSLDAATGKERWTYFTEGPIRLAPTVSDGRVYLGSDDGNVYCLSSNNGAVVWKARPSYTDDKVLGNGEMISLWPVRTGVLVDDGIAYFGAGVFPHASLFVCAVNAHDGTPVWTNDICGEKGTDMKYGQDFGGMSPQGYLLASDSKLYVASGRSMPAAFDRDDGEFLYYCSAAGKVGGTWALLTGDRLVAGTEEIKLFDKDTGRRTDDASYAWFPGLSLVVTEDTSYLLTERELCALDRQAYRHANELRRTVVSEREKLRNSLRNLYRRRGAVTGEALEELNKRAEDLTIQLKALSERQKKVEDAVHKWRLPCKEYSSLILAGDMLFAGGDGVVVAVNSATGREVWNAKVNGRASGLAVANGRLLVSTDKGNVHCFGKTAVLAAQEIKPEVNESPYPEDRLTSVYEQAARKIVKDTGIKKGYCLVYGSGIGRLAFELANSTDLKIIGVEPDAGKVEVARKALDAAGIYGSRVTIEQCSLDNLKFADYFANLIVSDNIMVSGDAQGSSSEMFRVLKPCGGVTYFGQPAGASEVVRPLDLAALRTWLKNSRAPSPQVTESDGTWMKIVRGPLEGAGKWTHQYADPENTACSDDQLVRGSLEILWFGKPGPEQMVERHARAAAPVAMDGRLFSQGENLVMAHDSYNGVLLWEREIPGAVRVRVDSDMSNLALEKDGLYVAAHDKCYRLDPATGEILRTYEVPSRKDGKPVRWGYLASIGNTLFGSRADLLSRDYGATWTDMVNDDGTWKSPDEVEPDAVMTYGAYTSDYPEPDKRAYALFQYAGGMWRSMQNRWPDWGSTATPKGAVSSGIMASDEVFAMNADSGKMRWTYNGSQIAHPAITIGDGTVFLADCAVTEAQKESAIREKQRLIKRGIWEKGLDVETDPDVADVRLVVALDAATGQKQWERVIDLTGCGGDRMGMAYQDGILLFFGCFSNHDSGLFREGRLEWRRITALSGADGGDIWSKPLNYLRRPVVVGDKILIEPRACSVRTGEVKTRLHPLTGNKEEWEYLRPGHCCSATSASPNMFFLRGWFLWYYDMEKDNGMLPFGGIRPGCWINTIPANGLLLFPEASAGCRCSYPVRSTVVMKPTEEENKTWSIFIQHGDMTPVKHMAVNFGAPGDWRDDDGTVWFCYPHPRNNPFLKYGVNFGLQPQFIGDDKYFSRNFQGFDVKGTDKPWLFASGSRGLTECVLPLVGEGQDAARYTVRLYFVDTENSEAGQRVFNVALQGRTKLRNFDIVREAGGPNIAVVKEFQGIRVRDGLQVELIPRIDNPTAEQAPLINGIEVIRES